MAFDSVHLQKMFYFLNVVLWDMKGYLGNACFTYKTTDFEDCWVRVLQNLD